MTQSYNQISGTYDFGSIVRALQVQIAAEGGEVKEYPYNFQGITQAIQDLTFSTQSPPGANAGDHPSMGDVIIGPDGNPTFEYNTPPINGDLWFDTRQGRMFVAYNQEWYQTNGGDGLVIITTDDTAPSASNLAIGQQWYDRTNGILYIFAGVYKNPDGTTTTTPTAFTVPVWSELVNTADQQTTATLPLANPSLDPKILEAISSSNFLPTTFDPAQITHQDDVNLYYLDSLLALDDVIKLNQPTVSITPPASPVVGQFWFDSTNIEMSIWYSAPGDAWGQWVPVFSPAKLDDNLTTLTNRLTVEIGNREVGDATLQTEIDALSTTVSTNKGTLQNGIDGLQAQINAIPSIDLSPYITAAQEQVHITNLQNQVSALTGDVGNIYTKYSKISFVDGKVADLQSQINARATLTSTIDLGARLDSTKTALTNLRTNAATATTLDELKSAIATALANV